MKEVMVKVYGFDELKGQARENAVNETIRFMLETTMHKQLPEDVRKAVDKAEELQTPWFAHEYIWDYAKEDVLDECRDHSFTVNGDMFPWHITTEIYGQDEYPRGRLT